MRVRVDGTWRRHERLDVAVLLRQDETGVDEPSLRAIALQLEQWARRHASISSSSAHKARCFVIACRGRASSCSIVPARRHDFEGRTMPEYPIGSRRTRSGWRPPWPACAVDSPVRVDDPEQVQAKLALLADAIAKLRRLLHASVDEFRIDDRTIDAAPRRLQVSLQILIDVGSHVVANLGLGAPETSGEILERLERAGRPPAGLSTRSGKMFSFRNRVVHFYDRVDDEVVYEVVNRLVDLEEHRTLSTHSRRANDRIGRSRACARARMLP